MSEKKKGVSWNIKLKDHPSRFSLTAMFAGSAFAILLAALLIVGIPALVLVNTGVLSIGDGGLLTFNRFMVLMGLVLIRSLVHEADKHYNKYDEQACEGRV